MWFTDHGRDWMGDDMPNDELNRMTKTGLHFGFPYCHAKGVPDADIKRADPCGGVTVSQADMGPHAANMGLHFYTGNMFPAEYKNMMFVARKGSWNRTKRSGFEVVTVSLDANGQNPTVKPFITGFKDDTTDDWWGRPTYFLQMPDGAMLLSDEQTGAIYRISYAK
jgi:glucose/arabinose dehydrogenase